MYNKFLISLAYLTLITTVLLGQNLDQKNSAYEDLRPIIENASRSQQIVWVEDFTGLN